MKKMIIFDFDGTIRSNTNNYREEIQILKKINDKGITDKKEIGQFMINEFVKNCKIPEEIQSAIKELNQKYILVIFSMASKDYIIKNLMKYDLIKCFKRIYSTIDDFNSKIKEKEHFTKIFEDFSCKPKEVIHICDDYGIDYISNELDCETFLIENYPIKRLSIAEILEKVKNG